MNENENRPSGRKVIRSVIIFAVYIAVLVFLIRYVSRNADIMERIAAAPKVLVAFGLLAPALSVTLSAFLDITCAKAYGIKLTVPDAVVFTFVASAINLVIPLQMGSVIKAIYYKKKMALSYSRYISILSGTVVISLTITFVLLIISLFVTMMKWNTDRKYVLLLSAIFLAAAAVFAVVLRKQDRILDILPFQKYTRPVMAGFFEIINSRRAMALCSGNFLLSMLLGGLRFVSIFSILGMHTGFVNGMLYYALYRTSSIVPILPGNIGISEAIVGVMNMILGEAFDAGVTTVLINRIYYYMVALLGAVIAAIPAWRMFRNGSEREKNERNEEDR
jgi:uncharacterized membrane protein YbhN (UPF0104 family)